MWKGGRRMRNTGNTRIVTLDPCTKCEGKGTISDGTETGFQCHECNGTGRKSISLAEIARYIDESFGRTLRRLGNM